jgi:hypothetical protein
MAFLVAVVVAALVMLSPCPETRAQTLAPLPDLGLMDVRGGSVEAIAVQADGKVVIGGDFTLVNGVRRDNIARLNADGTLDTGWNPDADLNVRALAVAGNTVYAAGYFGRIGGQARRFLAALDGTTGAATAWDPNPDQGVNTIVVAGSLVYVGGNFGTIGGQTRKKIAALDAATGNATAWDPNATLGLSNTTVYTIAVLGSTVYVGGSFTFIGGQARSKLAALDATTGAATAWDPNPTGGNSPGVDQLAIAGSTVYVAGSFTTIGGQARTKLAALDATTGNATAWNPNPSPSSASLFALAASGSAVYVGSTFTTIGGQPRSFLAALDLATANATAWNPSPSADAFTIGVRTLAVANGTVYVGGSFNGIAGEAAVAFARLDEATGQHVAGFRPAVGHGGSVSALAAQTDGKIAVAGDFLWAGKAGVARRRLLRLNADGTLDLGWNPAPERAVRALAALGTTVYTAGNFLTIGGAARNRIAALDGATGNATAWNPDADQPVAALAIDGTTVYAGGGFTTISGAARNGLAALDAATGAATGWDPNVFGVTSIAVAGGTIYVGGGFTQAAGQVRLGLAAFDAVTGSLTDWNPGANGGVSDLVLAGTSVYAAGAFNAIGGQTRNRIAELDAATGVPTAWNPDADGAVSTLVLTGDTLYAGGTFTSIGGQARSRIAALDTAIGSATAWDPETTGGNSVFGTQVQAQLISGSAVHVGGFFSTLLGADRDGLGTLSLSSGGGSAVGLVPARLGFGEQGVGTTGAARTVTLVNYGAVAVEIASIVTSGDFAATNDCGPTLAPAARCTIAVTFSPTVIGPHDGAVTVTSAAAGSPHVASLDGLAPEVGQFCCQLSVEGCGSTVHHTASRTRSTHVIHVDLPAASPTATGPSIDVGDFLGGTSREMSRSTAFGPATILVGEDQGQTCFVSPGHVNVNEHTHTSTFVYDLFQPTEPAPPLDHFVCYKTAAAKAPKGTAPFPKFAPTSVTAVDARSTTDPSDQHRLDLKKPFVVCNPADTNGEDPTSPTHAVHLAGYAAKISKTVPKQPKPVKTVVGITNQIGPLQLQVKAPDRLLVPTAKALGSGGTPDLGATSVDHFKCYRAKVAKAKKGETPFPVFTKTSVTLTDQFGGPRIYDLKKPTRLCLPANKNDENPAAPAHPDRLVCYAAKLAKQKPKQPKFIAQVVSTANQFGPEVLRAKKLEELCVPSSEIE